MADIALLGLSVIGVPSAEATTVKTLAFVGTTQMNAGFSFPCFPAGTLAKCPQTPPLATVTQLPLPAGGTGSGIPNFSVRIHGGNVRSYTFATSTCLIDGVNVNKLNKPVTHGVAPCGITATGVLSGWCGPLQGQGTADLTDGLGQVITVTFHLTGIVPLLIVTGHAVKPVTGQRGKFFAVKWVIPPTPATSTQSCTDKTAATATSVGTGTLVL